jgi:hypothetical protein
MSVPYALLFFFADIGFVIFAIFYDCVWASGVVLVSWRLITNEAIRKRTGSQKPVKTQLAQS